MQAPTQAADPSVDESPQGGTLDLSVLRVGDAKVEKLDTALLDAEELRRAATLKRAADRERYIAAHVCLRRLLGARLGLSPEKVAFAREPCPHCGGPHGRPILAGSPLPLHFSLAHGGDLVLIGIAFAPLGVDIEPLPEKEALREVIGLLHPAERREIASTAPAERTAAFTRLWVRKEAYLKGTGKGVGDDLAADYLGTKKLAEGPQGWTVLTLPLMAAGYAGAAAVRGQLASVQLNGEQLLISKGVPASQ